MSRYFENNSLFNEPKVTQYGSHMVMTNVSKDTKKMFINIDTKYCDEYINQRTDASDCMYNLSVFNVTLPNRINDVKNILVCNMEVPLTLYNISAARGNNYFKITIATSPNATTRMITIPDGQYSAQTLNVALNNAFAANAVSKYRMYSNVGDVSNCMVLYAQSNNTVEIPHFTVDFAVDANGNFDKYNFKSKLGWLLGYRKTTYNVLIQPSTGTLIPSVGIVSESFINLNGPSYLYLAIDEFSKGNQTSFLSSLPNYMINKNIIAKVSLNRANYPFGSVLTANTYNGYLMTDKRSYSGTVDIQKLALQLLDDNGNPVNLNGLDFSFCLQIEHE